MTKIGPGATRKPNIKMVELVRDGRTYVMPADAAGLIKAKEDVLASMMKRRDELSKWWSDERAKVENRDARIRQLEGTLRSLAQLARLEIGEFEKRRDPIDLDEIPF